MTTSTYISSIFHAVYIVPAIFSLKSIHYKCVLTVSVVSSEDDLSPSATLCLFRQAEENELLWHVDEQNCPIFLQIHAFRPLSRKHIPLHLHTVLLSLKGSLDAWSTSLSSNCSSVWSSESSMLLLSILQFKPSSPAWIYRKFHTNFPLPRRIVYFSVIFVS
jgi:hypothetical protein